MPDVDLTMRESKIDRAVYQYVKDSTGKVKASDITEQDIWRGYTFFIQNIASICLKDVKLELVFLEMNITEDRPRALYMHRLRNKVFGKNVALAV